MFVDSGISEHSLCIVSDFRLKSDKELDEAESAERPHVLDFWRVGRKALGSNRYDAITRVALFEYGSEPTTEERASARAKLLALAAKCKVTCVLPTLALEEEVEDRDKPIPKADTVAWHAFKAPDALHEMRGTFFEHAPGCYVMPLFPNSPYLKELQYWQQSLWLGRADEIARGRRGVKRCPRKIIDVGEEMLSALQGMKGASLAVDIESIEQTGQITAIGVSNGGVSVSVPWDAYKPYGAERYEPGIYNYSVLGAAIATQLGKLLAAATPKALHNYTFDVPRLQAKGLPLGGRFHDTFAAHAVKFPELKHGLQHACASLMCVPPWKSAWHPKLRGITRDDIEFWICDPIGLRDYNADDAFYTWHLAREVLPYVNVTWG